MNLGSLPERVTVYEVGPRDGLQNEPKVVAVGAKRAFVEALAAAGLPYVEATSFVRPRWVPQLADASQLFSSLERREGTRYPVLVPNSIGLDRALEAGAREVAVFLAASESFSRQNTNASVGEAFARARSVVERARAEGLWVRAYLSVCWGCPFEGAVDPARVGELAGELLDMGAEQLSLGDTIGVANPKSVGEILEAVAAYVPRERIALHLHDARGTALANVLAGLQLGVTIFDTSAGGLGGCPYAPGASGNVATEDVLWMLEGMGIETGVDLAAVRAASRAMSEVLGRPLPGRYATAGPFVPQGIGA